MNRLRIHFRVSFVSGRKPEILIKLDRPVYVKDVKIYI